ncbi:MAG: patatin-like phospholipase family protein [Geminicoccaceae bacterium]
MGLFDLLTVPTLRSRPLPEAERIALAEFGLFAELSAAVFRTIEPELQIFSLPAGWTLFEQGEEADGLFVLISGRLQIVVGGDQGRERSVNQIGPGETVGEMGVLTGDARTGTVVAVRDSELVKLGRPVFDVLVQKQPDAILHLTRILVRRLRRITQGTDKTAAIHTICVQPLDRGVDAEATAQLIADAFTADGRKPRILDHRHARHTTSWYHSQEHEHDVVIYVGQPRPTAWTRLSLRQADRVLLLTNPTSKPLDPTLSSCLEGMLGGRLSDLVVLHDQPVLGSVAHEPWLDRLPVACRWHLCLTEPADQRRLVRIAMARAVGLVLSGGGARGFAHLGVVRALTEAGIDYDIVTGTSMGALIAAGLAMRWPFDAFIDRLKRSFLDINPIGDYTLPVVSLARGNRLERLFRTHFVDVAIEDLPLPFRCTASDLGRSEIVTLDKGMVRHAVLASLSIPGLVPPVLDGDRIFVDGALISTLPVELVSDLGRGPTIAVDVGGEWKYALASTAVIDGLKGIGLRGQAPPIASLIMRAATAPGEWHTRHLGEQADVLIKPPVNDLPLLDWQSMERAIEVGYQDTKAKIADGTIQTL